MKTERLHRPAMPDLHLRGGGKTILATSKPTTLLAMFDAPRLEGMARKVKATIVKIMKDAASG